MLINLETALALLLLSLVGGGGSIPSVVGQNAVSNITANDIIDLVDNVTESDTDNESPLPLEAIEGLSSIPFVNDADTSYVTAGDSILINEAELNPIGNDMGKEWIELYNPTAVDVNISNFEIRPLFTSATIKLPSDAVKHCRKPCPCKRNRRYQGPNTISCR